MASGIYDRFKANLFEGLCNVSSGGDVIGVLLCNSAHTFVATHNVDTNVSGNEISGTGYATGGGSLSGQAVVQSLRSYFDANDISWGPGASFTANHGVLYDDTLVGDDLICSFDFGGAQQVTNGTFTIQWNAIGILTIATSGA